MRPDHIYGWRRAGPALSGPRREVGASKSGFEPSAGCGRETDDHGAGAKVLDYKLLCSRALAPPANHAQAGKRREQQRERGWKGDGADRRPVELDVIKNKLVTCGQAPGILDNPKNEIRVVVRRGKKSAGHRS